MKDARVGQLACSWARAFDEHEEARRRLGEAHRKANATEIALAEAKRDLLAQISSNASLVAMDKPIVVRAWEKHHVIVDVKNGIITDAIHVDRD